MSILGMASALGVLVIPTITAPEFPFLLKISVQTDGMHDLCLSCFITPLPRRAHEQQQESRLAAFGWQRLWSAHIGHQPPNGQHHAGHGNSL
jgi:hypothetical protein